MGQWEKVFSEGGKKFGRSFRILHHNLQKKGMEEAGVVDVVVRDLKCPIKVPGLRTPDSRRSGRSPSTPWIWILRVRLLPIRPLTAFLTTRLGKRVPELHVERGHGLDS